MLYSSPQLRMPDRYAGKRVSRRPVSVRRLSHLILTVFLGLLLTGNASYGQTGAALNFDGSDDYVDLGTGIPNTATFTLEAWVNPGTGYGAFPASSDPVEIISRWGLGGTGNASYRLGINSNGTLVGAVFNQSSGGSTVVTSTSVIAVNTWTHIAFTCSADNVLRIYINGVLAGTTTNSYVPQSSNYAVYLGKPIDGYNRYKGSIDEVRIWNRALLACEITNQRNCELPNGQTGLVAYYKFNQGTGTSLPDASGNNNNGTLSNFALTGGTSNWVATGGVTTGTSCPLFTITEGLSQTIGYGGNAQLTASTANSYVWSTGATTPAINAKPVSTTTYSVTGTTANGCAIATATVTVSAFTAVNCNTFITSTSATANGLASNTINRILAIGNTVYVATNRGLSISTDGGKTFVTRKVHPQAARTSEIVSIGNAIYVAARYDEVNGGSFFNQGILGKSTDGGQSFSISGPIGILPPLIQGWISLFVSGNKVFGAPSADIYLLSDNGGTSFTTVSLNSNKSQIKRFFEANGKIYMAACCGYAAPRGGLYISSDGGKTSTLDTRLDVNSQGTAIYVADNTIYYSSLDKGLLISTNGGASYTQRTTANGLGSNAIQDIFVDGNRVYAATANGLSISTDGGQTFTNYTTANGLPMNKVDLVYAVGTTVYAATAAGLAIANFAVQTIIPGGTRLIASEVTAAPGTSLTLRAADTNTGYNWTPGNATTQNITVTASGTYSVSAVGSCPGTGSVVVTYLQSQPATALQVTTSKDGKTSKLTISIPTGSGSGRLATIEGTRALASPPSTPRVKVVGPGGYVLNTKATTVPPKTETGVRAAATLTATVPSITKPGTYTVTVYDPKTKMPIGVQTITK